MSATDARIGPEASTRTVAEICETHAAARDNPGTQATYRARLRPVRDRYGELTDSEATARLPEIERELIGALGEERARNVITLLKAALRRAGTDPDADLIMLVQAARHHHIGVKSLQALVREERIRSRGQHAHGWGTSIFFDRVELADDLARLPRCRAPHCPVPAAGPSGYCGAHFSRGGRERAGKLERDVLGEHHRDWYTASEAVRAAPCSVSTLRKAIQSDKLQTSKVGRHRRIPKSELHKWAEGLKEDRPLNVKKPSAEQLAHRRERARRLHEQGHPPGELAKKLGVSKKTVHKDLAVLGLKRKGQGRIARRLPPAERERRQQRTVGLYLAGMSLADVAAKNDSSPAQVRRDLAASGVQIRLPRKQAKYPLPAARPCEECGRLFTPQFPASDMHRGQPRRMRFHSAACEQRWRATQRNLALAERGLLSTSEVAAELGVGAHRVLDFIKSGLLISQRVTYPGMLRPVYGVALKDVKKFLRDWAHGGDRRRTVHLDPDNAIAVAKRRGAIARMVDELGLTPEEARDVVRAQVARRRARLAQHRKGRKPAAGPTARDLRWFERVEYYRAELERQYLEDPDQLDGTPPTTWQAYLAAAEDDWREHPADWPRDSWPASPDDPAALHPKSARQAANKVLSAVKRLQNAHA